MEFEGSDLSGLDNEAGGHRIQRVPPTEKRGRVHTSTVTVAVMSEVENSKVELNANDLKIEWYSGSGAGGQHRNKHQNSCRLTHLPTCIVCKAETRSRESSYREAYNALTALIQGKAETKVRVERNKIRRDQMGSGMRGDKRRTYRFQDDTVHDHITGKQTSCSHFLKGNVNYLW